MSFQACPVQRTGGLQQAVRPSRGRHPGLSLGAPPPPLPRHDGNRSDGSRFWLQPLGRPAPGSPAHRSLSLLGCCAPPAPHFTNRELGRGRGAKEHLTLCPGSLRLVGKVLGPPAGGGSPPRNGSLRRPQGRASHTREHRPVTAAPATCRPSFGQDVPGPARGRQAHPSRGWTGRGSRGHPAAQWPGLVLPSARGSWA